MERPNAIIANLDKKKTSRRAHRASDDGIVEFDEKGMVDNTRKTSTAGKRSPHSAMWQEIDL